MEPPLRKKERESQSLFYWIIYSYELDKLEQKEINNSLNPYFTGLSILINPQDGIGNMGRQRLNPYFTGLSILMMKINML